MTLRATAVATLSTVSVIFVLPDVPSYVGWLAAPFLLLDPGFLIVRLVGTKVSGLSLIALSFLYSVSLIVAISLVLDATAINIAEVRFALPTTMLVMLALLAMRGRLGDRPRVRIPFQPKVLVSAASIPVLMGLSIVAIIGVHSAAPKVTDPPYIEIAAAHWSFSPTVYPEGTSEVRLPVAVQGHRDLGDIVDLTATLDGIPVKVPVQRSTLDASEIWTASVTIPAPDTSCTEHRVGVEATSLLLKQTVSVDQYFTIAGRGCQR